MGVVADVWVRGWAVGSVLACIGLAAWLLAYLVLPPLRGGRS